MERENQFLGMCYNFAKFYCPFCFVRVNNLIDIKTPKFCSNFMQNMVSTVTGKRMKDVKAFLARQ